MSGTFILARGAVPRYETSYQVCMSDTRTKTNPQMSLQSPAPPASLSTVRTVVALMLREMSTTYGRSALGYFWAILEPVGGILLMSVIFSMAFRAPGIGTSFPLFFASGILPFMAYMDVSSKMSSALKFSKPLLFYPRVTYTDALLARFMTNALTQLLIATILFWAIILLFDLDVILNIPAMVLGFLMAFVLGAGIGTLNCFLLSVFPLWERLWGILNRPLFIISCVIFLFDSIPMPYRDWLWWNPIVHCIGQVRAGVYATYDATYVSPIYVFAVGMVCQVLGLLLLRRYHRDIINF